MKRDLWILESMGDVDRPELCLRDRHRFPEILFENVMIEGVNKGKRLRMHSEPSVDIFDFVRTMASDILQRLVEEFG